jgi:quercetin dioxygenase-like cupin family protein
MRMETTKPQPAEKQRALAPESATIDLQREAAALRKLDSWSQHGHGATTLFKYPDLRCVLIAVKSGARIREHQAEGRLALHCLRGKLKVQLDGHSTELGAGQVLALERCVPHEIEAVEESDLLLTLAWAGHQA